MDYVAQWEQVSTPPVEKRDQTTEPTPTPTPKIPESSGGNPYVWALLNLIMAIIGVILAIITAIRTFGFKKQDDDTENQEQTEEEKQQKNQRFGGTIMVIVAGIAGIVLFFFTENTKYLMVLIDKWTIVNAIILIVGIVSYVFAFRRKRDEKKPQPASYKG